jgi:hypothetical protein
MRLGIDQPLFPRQVSQSPPWSLQHCDIHPRRSQAADIEMQWKVVSLYAEDSPWCGRRSPHNIRAASCPMMSFPPAPVAAYQSLKRWTRFGPPAGAARAKWTTEYCRGLLVTDLQWESSFAWRR